MVTLEDRSSTSAGGAPPDLLTDLIAEAAGELTDERLAVRTKAIADARELIDAKLGALDERDVRRIFELFNTDHFRGTTRANRFSPAFSGALANKMLARLPELNRWIERLWRSTGDDDAARTLEDLWGAGDLPGAGRSLPTMVLHARQPDRYPPLMGSLGQGFAKITGQSVKGRTAKAYLAYVHGVRGMIERSGVSPHTIDVVLAMASRARASTSTLAPSAVADPSGFAGFTVDAFSFLRELSENNNSEWFDANKPRFKNELREPMRALIVELGRIFVQEVDPELEHEPKSPNTLASIRKNAYGHIENPYWPHYWAAIHRRGHKKSADLQLLVALDPVSIRWGLFTSSAPDAIKAQLIARLRQDSPLVRRAVAEALAHGVQFARSGGEWGSPDREEVRTPAELADLIDAGAVLFASLEPEAAQARGKALAEDINATFRALYPLWLLATSDHADVLARYWDDDEPGGDDDDHDDIQTREWLLEQTAMGEEFLEEVEALIAEKPQIVLYGPPGTGKTWLAERIARCYAAEDAIELIQFHASYGYEDFIEGLRPVCDPVSGQLRYDVVPGVFRDICERARLRPRAKFVLIIDEINRGNLPRIFGELLYLLDRRGPRHHVTLGISRIAFSVPENLILIGTMNTADQSIALLDSALRRRFQFVRLDPDPGLLERWLARNGCQISDVPRLLERLNQELRDAGVDRNLLVGHSHFMRPDLDAGALRRVWERSVVPSLEDHFYNQLERLDRFAYDEFVEPEIEELLPEGTGPA